MRLDVSAYHIPHSIGRVAVGNSHGGNSKLSKVGMACILFQRTLETSLVLRIVVVAPIYKSIL